MTLSSAQKQLVRERANHCCEYCLLSAETVTVRFHVDHIIPLKHGGTDDRDNLCLACAKCNAHKSHDLAGYDPQTNKITALFHPRNQEWDTHFRIDDEIQIVGLTPIGRTTVSVLRMNDDDRLENRQILAEMDEYPCR